MKTLSRRAALRGAGVAVVLPWLEAMSPRKCAHAAGAKRFVTWFTPNGTIREAWTPTGSETSFEMSRILAPLDAFKKDLVLLDGLDQYGGLKPGPGDDHMKGMGCRLTGTALLPGKTTGGGGTPSGLAGGISVDQEIVRQTRPGTRFPSLELGVQSGSEGTVWGYSNYRGPGQGLPLDNNPVNVFNRIFAEVGTVAGDDSAFLRIRAQRKSVLDLVQRNFALVNQQLGVVDRQRVDQHLTTVRELELRTGSMAPAPISKSCVRPPDLAKVAYRANDSFPMVGKLQMDLLVMALQCDLTRVVSLQWENSVGQTRFTWLGASRGHHEMSHDTDDVVATKELLIKINAWFSEQLAYLLGKLKAIPDEGGTLLDNTLLFASSELARGNNHSHTDSVMLLAGGAGGRLKTGRFLGYEGSVPHNNLLVSILNLFDIPATTFGDPTWCTGPLARL